MTQQELEAKIRDLKGKQADYFKTKKSSRDAAVLTSVRAEMEELTKKAKEFTRKSKSAK